MMKRTVLGYISWCVVFGAVAIWTNTCSAAVVAVAQYPFTTNAASTDTDLNSTASSFVGTIDGNTGNPKPSAEILYSNLAIGETAA